MTVQWSPLPLVLLSMISVTCCQLWPEYIKWKIPEMNNMYFFMGAILHSVINSHAIPLHPSQDEFSLCPVCPHSTRYLPASYAVALSRQSHYGSSRAYVQVTLFH
jgi:hypothetical protein